MLGEIDQAAERVHAEIALAGSLGRSLPPFSISGARGWTTGYTVSVMSGALSGWIQTGARTLTLDGGIGYYDHNRGHWTGVSWRWGQVRGDGLSFVYGRVLPPREAADPDRMPGFLLVSDATGPLAYATRLEITEEDDPDTGEPRHIVVETGTFGFRVRMEIEVDEAARARLDRQGFDSGLDFYQLGATFEVSGQVGDRPFAFTAEGSAETFRGCAPGP